MNIKALGLEVQFASVASKRAWRRGIVGLAAANFVVLGAGIASATAWTSTVSGTGQATATSMTFTATASTPNCSTNNCAYPSSSATGDLVLTINNTSRFPIHVTSVTLTNTPTFLGGGKGTCNTNTLAQVSVPTTAIAVPTTSVATESPATATAGGSQTVTLVNAVTMGTSADDGCQGAGFTFPASVTAVIN